MSGELWFPLRPVLLLVEATLAAREHTSGYADRQSGVATGPALVWAKDTGTYLMSNAVPRPEVGVVYGRAQSRTGLLLEPPPNGDDAAWDDVWDATRRICGGDDFAEYLPLRAELRAGLLDAGRRQDRWFVLEVSETSLGLRTAP